MPGIILSDQHNNRAHPSHAQAHGHACASAANVPASVHVQANAHSNQVNGRPSGAVSVNNTHCDSDKELNNNQHAVTRMAEMFQSIADAQSYNNASGSSLNGNGTSAGTGTDRGRTLNKPSVPAKPATQSNLNNSDTVPPPANLAANEAKSAIILPPGALDTNPDPAAKFSSARAMFASLERQSQGAIPSFWQSNSHSTSQSPVSSRNSSPSKLMRSAGLNVQPTQTGSLPNGSVPVVSLVSPRAPPPLPPKPRTVSVDTSYKDNPPQLPQPPPPIDSPSSSGSIDTTADNTPAAPSSQNPNETSPLSEMSRHFDELVQDLELMSSPRVSSAASNATAASSSSYPRITHSLHMDRQQNSPSNQTHSNVTTPTPATSGSSTSTYEPYWRNHSWYTKRYPAVPNVPPPPPPAPVSDDRTASSVSVSEPAATAYGLFRTRRTTDDEQAATPESTRDSGVGSVNSSEQQLIRMRKGDPVSSTAPPINTVHNNTTAAADNAVWTARGADAAGSSVVDASGVPRPLCSHVRQPQDIDGQKRWSMCSHESSAAASVDGRQSRHEGAMSPDQDLDATDLVVFPDGHYRVYVPGVPPLNDDDPLDGRLTPTQSSAFTYKPPSRVRFSTCRMLVYSTHSMHDYDRRNDDIDPVSSSAEYELERRIEKMQVDDVQLNKGSEGLGFSIIGMGVGADAGLEKLGIFVKSITAGGAVHRDGRIQVCDQIIEVDGVSLVGVSQAFAAGVLRNTQGTVRFRIGREHDLDSSEIACLIKQSLEQDKVRMPPPAPAAQAQKVCERVTYESSSAQQSSTDTEDMSTPRAQSPINGNGTANAHPHIDSLMDQLKQHVSEQPVTMPMPNVPVPPPEHSLSHTELDNTPLDECQVKAHTAPSDAVDTASTSAAHAHATDADSAFHSVNNPVAESALSELSTSTGVGVQYSMAYQTQTYGTTTMLDTNNALRQNNHVSLLGTGSSVESSPASSRRSAQSVPYSIEERELSHKINYLEHELDDTHQQADRLHIMLSQSTTQYHDLEQKYSRAKKMLKDYEDRERNLLEREEAHLRQLREKDNQYSMLVKQLNQKIVNLESSLNEAVLKRASMVEARQDQADKHRTLHKNSSEHSQPITAGQSVMVVPVAECSTQSASDTPQDISPALAYQPARQQQHATQITIDGVDQHVPVTDTLDCTAAKSKFEAVNKSQTMSCRNLPSRRGDTEVLIACHHTLDTAPVCQTAEAETNGESNGVVSDGEERLALDLGSSEESKTMTYRSVLSPPTPRRLLQHISLPNTFKRHVMRDQECSSRDTEIANAVDVLTWSVEQVCTFVSALGLHKYTPEFTVNKVDGPKFLALDGSKLKAMGVHNHTDRQLLKKRLKELKSRIDKERKAVEKETRARSGSKKR